MFESTLLDFTGGQDMHSGLNCNFIEKTKKLAMENGHKNGKDYFSYLAHELAYHFCVDSRAFKMVLLD